jgi:hypothetical protein
LPRADRERIATAALDAGCQLVVALLRNSSIEHAEAFACGDELLRALTRAALLTVRSDELGPAPDEL